MDGVEIASNEKVDDALGELRGVRQREPLGSGRQIIERGNDLPDVDRCLETFGRVVAA